MSDKENISCNIPLHSLDRTHPAPGSNKTADTVNDAKAFGISALTHT